MPHFFVPPSRFLTAASLLGAATTARAQETPPLALTPPLAAGATSGAAATGAAPAPGVSRAQFFGALGEQVSFVGALRSWRETLRASGDAPRRELWDGPAENGRFALSLGNVGAPNVAGFDAGAGTAFSWQGQGGQKFDVGTTSRPAQLDQLLQRFDAQMSDAPALKAAAPLDGASVTWLRARPLSNARAEVEATFLRAARDEQSGEGERWKSGTFADVDARFALTSKWLLRGSWTGARLDGGQDRANWNAAASGIVSHPWGQADVKLDWKTTDAGFSTFSGANASGESGGSAQITQNIKTALVSGTLDAHTATRSLQSLDGARPGDELSRDTTRADADLKAQLAPGLAFSATGRATQVRIEQAAADSSALPARQSLLQTSGDVGLDWQVSKRVSLGAGAGFSQTSDDMMSAGPIPENRATLRLRFANSQENYAMALQMRDRDLSIGGQSETRWAHLAALRLEAERPLVGDWRLKTSANWMIDRDAAPGTSNGVARQIVAGLQFARAARFDVRYRDGAALPLDLRNDLLGAAFSSPGASGSREIATRFNIGSATGTPGFGLALEWARQGAASSPNDSWKIGLTYR